MATLSNTPSSYKHFQSTLSTDAPPEVIWSIWTDVDNWQDWDSGLKQAELKGPFALGTKGRLIPDRGPKASFKITEYEEGKSYTFRTALPLGGLFVKRYLEVKEGKTYFTHEVWFSGLTGGFFAKRLGKEYQKMLPDVLQKIKKIAEQKNS